MRPEVASSAAVRVAVSIGGERAVAANIEPGGGNHKLLFGGEHLEIPLRVGAGELASVGGVADFSIQRDDQRIPGAEGDQRVAVGLAGGHFLTDSVVRRWRVGFRWIDRLCRGGN